MTKLFQTTALCSLLAASPALADLSVDDAWATWKAQFTAYGLMLNAAETRDGDALQIGNIRLSLNFPMGQGSAYASFEGPRFEPVGDGRVRVIFPETSNLAIGGEITGEGSLALALELQHLAKPGIMSGSAGDVVTEWSSQSTDIRLVDLAVSGEQAVNLSGSMMIGPMTTRNTTKIDETHVTISAVSEIGGYDLSYALDIPGGEAAASRVTATGMAGKTLTDSLSVLPRGGLDLLGLHNQLADGLQLVSRVSTELTRSSQLTTLNGNTVMDQKGEAHDYDITAKLDATGLSYVGSTGAFAANVTMQELPFPVALGGTSVDFRLLVPLLMGEDQDAALRMALNEMTISDNIWGLFDPEGKLPRDPMTVALDMGSKASLLFEFLDIRSLIGGARPPALPVMAKTATLNELHLSGAGAEVTGTGDFTFDYTDWQTFPGMPAPDGRAAFTIIGANGLIGTLVEMGLVPEQDAMGAQMMLGMFTRPGEGDDVLTTEIEVRKTGEVLANGQRLK